MNYFHNIALHLKAPEGNLLKYLNAGAKTCENMNPFEFAEATNKEQALFNANYAMQTCPAPGGQLIAGLIYTELLVLEEEKPKEKKGK